MWWFLQSSRLQLEKSLLKELEGQCDWLRVKNWYAHKDLNMFVDFDICLSDQIYSFKMRYPNIYPDTPPMIFTSNGVRVSEHQYGESGELCLEHRPDNWNPELTGLDMVKSCYKLLRDESLSSEIQNQVRSAHVPSLGRDLRNVTCRFMISSDDIIALNELDEKTIFDFKFREKNTSVNNVFVSFIVEVESYKSSISIGDCVISKGERDYSGFVLRLPDSELASITGVEDLGDLLDRLGLTNLKSLFVDSNDIFKILIGSQEDWRFLWLYSHEDERRAIIYTTVKIPKPKNRLSHNPEILKGKRVGIVGLGSVGSKIAACLCRSGVNSFLLVDEDIFFPENIVRNELSLSSLGMHKADAVKDRLNDISPTCEVISFRLSLGGQESARFMSGTMEALGKCDLLIDATGDSVAFNYISSIARRNKKPMVLAEVFAGGIGGLVTRSRPELDPTPAHCKCQVEDWCIKQGVDWHRPENSFKYEGVGDDGLPMIAYDSEVSVIASHASRFALDCLTRPGNSEFPYSAYLIGLSTGWLFSQPFDTYPIELSPKGGWGVEIDSITEEEAEDLLREHLILEDASSEDNNSKKS